MSAHRDTETRCAPPGAAKYQAAVQIAPRRSAAVTEFAREPGARARFRPRRSEAAEDLETRAAVREHDGGRRPGRPPRGVTAGARRGSVRARVHEQPLEDREQAA